jgi:membrane fusion protein, multidrug efflux system
MRIALDAHELTGHPLQSGLSMQVEVDTHERGGERLPQVGQATTALSTDVYDSVDAAAANRVRAIIAANDRDSASARATSVGTTHVARASAAAAAARQVAASKP